MQGLTIKYNFVANVLNAEVAPGIVFRNATGVQVFPGKEELAVDRCAESRVGGRAAGRQLHQDGLKTSRSREGVTSRRTGVDPVLVAVVASAGEVVLRDVQTEDQFASQVEDRPGLLDGRAVGAVAECERCCRAVDRAGTVAVVIEEERAWVDECRIDWRATGAHEVAVPVKLVGNTAGVLTELSQLEGEATSQRTAEAQRGAVGGQAALRRRSAGNQRCSGECRRADQN